MEQAQCHGHVSERVERISRDARPGTVHQNLVSLDGDLAAIPIAARVCANSPTVCQCEGSVNLEVNRASISGPGRAGGNRSPVTDLNLSSLQVNTAALAIAAGGTGGEASARALNGN